MPWWCWSHGSWNYQKGTPRGCSASAGLDTRKGFLGSALLELSLGNRVRDCEEEMGYNNQQEHRVSLQRGPREVMGLGMEEEAEATPTVIALEFPLRGSGFGTVIRTKEYKLWLIRMPH